MLDWSRSAAKNQSIPRNKIKSRAGSYRQNVRDDVTQTSFLNQNPHQNYVARDGKQAVGQIEIYQPGARAFAPTFNPVCPGPALMPKEVVQYGGFNRQGGGDEVVQVEAVCKSH
jgi:hypothetical protein